MVFFSLLFSFVLFSLVFSTICSWDDGAGPKPHKFLIQNYISRNCLRPCQLSRFPPSVFCLTGVVERQGPTVSVRRLSILKPMSTKPCVSLPHRRESVGQTGDWRLSGHTQLKAHCSARRLAPPSDGIGAHKDRLIGERPKADYGDFIVPTSHTPILYIISNLRIYIFRLCWS